MKKKNKNPFNNKNNENFTINEPGDVRKPDFCISVTAKLISAFVFATRILQSLCILNPKVSIHFLWMPSPVCVGPGRKPRRPVFWRRGSYRERVVWHYFRYQILICGPFSTGNTPLLYSKTGVYKAPRTDFLVTWLIWQRGTILETESSKRGNPTHTMLCSHRRFLEARFFLFWK